jgi:putative OPT family oligopeptide transporter
VTDTTSSAPAVGARIYPELTWYAVIVGWFLGAIIAISIGYAALILGFSIEGSELAAILGFGILRGLLRRRSIIEVNVVQTIASAVNAASAGMMFSVPAIFILGYGNAFDPYLLTFACIAGAFLGIAFIIPLRKQMIDFERLTYPGGVAVATILKSPGAGMHKATLLVGAALLSGGLHFIPQMTGVTDWNVGADLGLPVWANAVWYLSLLTLGVAFIAGRGGVAFIIGGFVVWWLITPLLAATDAFPVDTATGAVLSDPGSLRGLLFRPVGIGMLIGGAVMGVILSAPLIGSAIRSMRNAAKAGSAASADEMPISLLFLAIVGAALLLGAIAVNSTAATGLNHGIAMAVVGTLWIWIAGVILSEAIGRTNWSPLSGMTLVGVTILVFIVSDLERGDAIVAAVMVGAAMAVAMAQATDLMLDLKTGYLVGATPAKQQLGQFMGAWLGPLIVIVLLFVLHEAYGLGSARLPAPQGAALAETLNGLLGGDAPVWKYLAGAATGALLTATQGGLGVTVGLGFYLPFNIVLTYALGTIARELSDRSMGHTWSEETGIPIAAGFIVGEALVGVGFAVTFVVQGMMGG